MHTKPRWLEWLEYISILMLQLFVIRIKNQRYLVHALAWLFDKFILSLKRIANHNLQIAFSKQKSHYEILKIRRQSFIHFIRLILEILTIKQRYKGPLDGMIYYSEGSIETIKKLYDKGKGIICVSAHYGNWEILALVIARLGYPLNIVYRPLENRLLDQFIYKLRRCYPSRLIDIKNSYKQGLSALKQGEVLALMIDQNQAKNPVFVPFFGKAAACAKGASILAHRTGASIMAATIQRNDDLSHTVTFKKINRVDSPNFKDFIYENTKKYTSFFEEIIRKEPEQWFWFHPRWKTRPDKENL